MSFKLKALLAAVAIAASAGANAAMDWGSGTGGPTGNSSLVFVAVDQANTIQLTVDLGLNYGDFFWNGGSSLLNPGASVVWDFGANTRSTNGASDSGEFGWTAAFSTFAATANVSNLQWAVIGMDGVNPASGAYPGRGWLATGDPSVDTLIGIRSSAVTGNANSIFNNFVAGSNNFGNHSTVANGANIATADSGVAYFFSPGGMGADYQGWQPWSYLMGNLEASRFTNVHQIVADPDTYTLGTPTVKDGLSPLPASFVFNFEEGTLTWAVTPVPEPGTYALLLAGLGVIGFVARRRRA